MSVNLLRCCPQVRIRFLQPKLKSGNVTIAVARIVYPGEKEGQQ
ncbi:hypothetical protein ACFTAO_10735 [Paenibacillus rhizoplanae]